MNSYATENGKIIQGDSIALMNTLAPESIDLIVTDPPYLCNYIDRNGRSVRNDGLSGHWVEDAYNAMYRVMKPDSWLVTFFGSHKIDVFADAWIKAGFRIVGNVVFPKPYTSSSKRALAWKHEIAYVLAKGKPVAPGKPLPTVLPWVYTGNKWHPTQKPIEAMTPIIEALSQPEDVVCDPFAGSGTTLVSAVKTGRQFLGMELDPVYFRSARKRVSYALRQ